MSTLAVADAPAAVTNPAALPGIPFTIASRPGVRFAAAQTVSVLNGPAEFQPIPLPACGYLRRISLEFNFTGAAASAGAVVTGDGPFNLLSGISLSDASGQSIQPAISGYNLYLINKYLPGPRSNEATWLQNPHVGPEYTYSATATTFSARFRLDIDLEQDPTTGYGSIPNMDSNASPILRISAAPYSVAFSGTTVSAATLSVRVTQHFWAPVSPTIGGAAVVTSPTGLGDFLETRYSTQTVSAGSINTTQLGDRGGLIKGILLVSRAAGVRTDWTAGSELGLIYDNNALYEGLTMDEWKDKIRRQRGLIGADLTTSYAPLATGTIPGLDRGVTFIDFAGEQAGPRDSWLATRVGTQLQVRHQPGASATQLEILTQMMQVRDAGAFYGR